jgi:transcriptional regulator with XRE-family HTH domain
MKIRAKDDALNLTVGMRIKALRSAKRMTQTDLANASGVNFQTIGKYERGQDCLSLCRLDRICRALAASIQYVVYGDTDSGDVSLDEEITAWLSHPHMITLLRTAAQLDPDAVKSLANMAEQMAPSQDRRVA